MSSAPSRSRGMGPGALVLSRSNTALAITRSLGRRGIQVWLVTDRSSSTDYSRYVGRSFPLPSGHDSELVDLLLSLAQQHDLRGWVLFPDSDRDSVTIAKYHEELGAYYQLTTPPWEVLQWSVDKRLTYQLAAAVGLTCPTTFFPSGRAEVEGLRGPFPMIVKPAHHQGQDGFSMGRAWQVNNADELIRLYDQMCGIADHSIIMLQEMIKSGPKTQYSYGALCQEGRVLADIFAERKRLNPPRFGVSAYVESIEDPGIEALASRWLAKNRYSGLVEIEFMLDVRDGTFKILDVNSRAWGWIALCGQAGVDFPYLLWQLVRGEEVLRVRARPGVGWSRTVYDLIAFLRAMGSEQAVAPREFFASLIHARHEMYGVGDSYPAAMELFLLARRGIQRTGQWLRNCHAHQEKV